MKTLTLLLAALLTFAQSYDPQTDPFQIRYQANRDSSLSGAAETITIQGTGSADAVYFEDVDIYCSADTVITFKRNGTAATGTALTLTGPVGTRSGNPPNAYRSSNVGSGTTLKNYTLKADSTLHFSLRDWYIPANAPSTVNYSIGTDSITATCRFHITFRLQR